MLADRELRVFICKPFAPDRDEFAFARSLSAPVKGRFALAEDNMKEQLEMFDAGTGDMASATDLAWAAGFIDGEGCITITKKKPHGHQKTGWYALELIATNTSKKTIDRIYELFRRGGVYKTSRGRAGWKPCFQWRCSDDGARMVLERILPYLFTKYDQARMAIEFANLPKVIAKKTSCA